ncbi:MAG: hypothetical protein JSV03_08960 [Planctomycetota bacterium]|nr:MAG: hypothetical protein JSV03_08960 [Planctomycetota bacterium]
MSRKHTPSPEARFFGVGGIIVCVFSAPFIVLYFTLGSWWMLIALLPLCLYIWHTLYGLLLLIAARWRWHSSSVQAVLITSDSPNWKNYIEKEWLPRLKDKVIILNWSQRKSWPRSLETRLFNYFCLTEHQILLFIVGEKNQNFNPALILLRGLHYPYVYRFYHAFLDAKHGRTEVLQKLESHMYAQFEKRKTDEHREKT